MIRTMYVNEQNIANVYCEDDTEIVFAVRNGTKVYLNNKDIICKNNADILPTGFRKSYSVSDKYVLKKGKNVIKTENDCKFLPNVFLIGDFSAETVSGEICTVKLSKRIKSIIDGGTFSDFGKVEFSAKLYIPEGVTALRINQTNLYTTVYMDDMCIGKKIFSPYVYNVDKTLWGKTVDLKIVQYSSLGPIFGDIEYYDKNSASVSWKEIPPTEKTLFGFSSIEMIFIQ